MGEKPDKDQFIDHFGVDGEEGYSVYWRRNRSPLEPIELANLLTSLRKVCKGVGRNIGDIVWEGMEVQNGLAISAAPALGHYPIPADKTDLMVGLTVHEALNKTEWSGRVTGLCKEQILTPDHYAYKLDMFLDFCERVYVDTVANLMPLSVYTEISREWTISEIGKQLISPPTVSEMLCRWWEMAANRDPDVYLEGYKDRSAGGLVERTNLEKFYVKPIDLLNDMVVPLREIAHSSIGVVEKCEQRVKLYVAAWKEMIELVKFWPGDRGDRYLMSDMYDEEIECEEEENEEVKKLIAGYLKSIDRIIDNKQKNLTDSVRDNVLNIKGVVRVEENDILMEAKPKADIKIYNRLVLLLRNIANRNTEYDRGYTSGKINSRRLYRAATTGAIFQRKKEKYTLSKKVIILVDATGSMADPVRWDRTEIIIQTLYHAFFVYNKAVKVIAYNEVRGTCKLTDIMTNGKAYTLTPKGKTASGEAIIAASLREFKPGCKGQIIHITDGASNWGCGVEEAIKFCGNKHIELVTLGVDCSIAAKKSLKEEYDDKVFFLERVNELPKLLPRLIKHG